MATFLTVVTTATLLVTVVHSYGVQQQQQQAAPSPYQQPQVQPVSQYQASQQYRPAYPQGQMVYPQPSVYGGGMAGAQVPGYGGNGQQGAIRQPGYASAPPPPAYGMLPGLGAAGGQYPMLLPRHTCAYDAECFKASPECTISNAYPFERRTPFNCTECLNLCLEKQFGEYPYICKSAVYDGQSRTCDIFAVDGLSLPQAYLKYPGRSVYRPTGVCQVAVRPEQPDQEPAHEEPTVSSQCPSGMVAKIGEIVGYAGAIDGPMLAEHDADECALACLTNQDKNGDAVPLTKGLGCQMAKYSKKTGCQLASEAMAIGDMQPALAMTTFKAICVPENQISDCPGHFLIQPHHVLVGFAKQVVTAQDEGDCILQCLNSYEASGFSCVSGMYYFAESQENCILNTEDRKTQPHVFTEDDDQVVYFELGCLKRRMRKAKSKLLKDAPEEDDWTEWSRCSSPDEDQVRFKRCGKKDVRQCQSERRKCKLLNSASSGDKLEPKKANVQ